MWSSSTPARLTTIALFVATAIAQQNATDEDSMLCSVQLRTRAGVIQRTDDWDLVPSTNTTLWPTAQLYITSEEQSRMYSSDGGRCGFNPYLRCSGVADFDSSKYGFYIASNGSLNFANRTVFWQCSSANETEQQENNAAPYIYPPIGAVDGAKLPSGCTAVNLTSSQCEAAQGSEFTVTPSGILTTASLTGGAGTGHVQMRTDGFLTETLLGLAGMLLAWL